MKHWSQYWQGSNALSSFAEGDAGQGYDGEVRAFWHFHLKDLDDDAVVVDVGTGNGALAVLAAEFAEQNKKNWTIHGVDAADINPTEYLRAPAPIKKLLGKVTFHGNTDMAKLPFDDNSVDCVLSQFALEYADKKAAVKEIMRVLKPGGKLVIMAHHASSSLVKDSETGIRIFDYALNQTPLFMQADLLVRIGHEIMKHGSYNAWKASQHGQATEKTTMFLMNMLRERFAKDEERVWLDDIITRVANIVAPVKSVEMAEKAMEALAYHYDLLQSHLQRVKDQVNAALTEKEVKALIKASGKASKQNDHSEFMLEDEAFAWAIEIVKSTDS